VVTWSVVMQRLGKHVFAATNTHATVEDLLGAVFSMESMSRLSGKDVSTEAEDIVGIRYQATIGEDLACAVVRSRVREMVRGL
jgi:hypothetical protein